VKSHANGCQLVLLGVALTWRARAAHVKGATMGVFHTGSGWPDMAVAAVMVVLALTAGRSVIQPAHDERGPMPAPA
jgi:hypothetical protein